MYTKRPDNFRLSEEIGEYRMESVDIDVNEVYSKLIVVIDAESSKIH